MGALLSVELRTDLKRIAIPIGLLVLILRQCKPDVIIRAYNIYRCRCLFTVFVFVTPRPPPRRPTLPQRR